MEEAEIAIMQGDPELSNSNLFSATIGRRGIDVYDSEFFTYFVQRDRTQADRQTPESPTGSYDPPPFTLPNGDPHPNFEYFINIISEFEDNTSCETGNFVDGGNEIVNNIPCPIPYPGDSDSEEQLEMLITSLTLQLNTYWQQIQNVSPFSLAWFEAYAQIAHINKCLQRALWEQMNFHGTEHEYEKLLESAEKGEKSVKRAELLYKPIAFGYLMYNGEYDLAESYIDSWEDISEEITDYKYAQKINIRYLRNPNEFVLLENERQELYEKSLKQLPLNAHIRSLYYILTGELTSYIINKDGRDEESSEGRSDGYLDQEIKVFPNPTNDKINMLNLPLGQVQLELYTLQGKWLQSEQIENVNAASMDISNLEKGIYLVRVIDMSSGTSIHTQKVLKL